MNTLLVCLAVLCLQAPAPTDSDPAKADIPRLQVQRLFPNIRLRRPVQAVQAPGDDKHLYVLEQAGRVMRLDLTKPDATEAEVWMDIREQVNSAGNELGLLSIVFDPKFADTHQFFLYYTANKPLRSELTRFDVAPATGMPVLKSAKVFLEVKQPYSNHNGGTVLFGPDGMLYLSLGDGGAANDPHGNSQNMGALLGKIIRIDVRRSEGGEPYAIPADNPFVDNPKAAPEIWATGLRNVWRMSFDRKTGQLYAGDVGQNAYEEVDLIVKGGNYGWNPREGLHAFDKGKPGTAGAAYIDPIAEYPHDQGVSVTGGHVYRGSKWPSLQGVYLYADYAFGTIWGLRCNGDRCTPSEVVWQRQGGKSMWSSFGELNNGELVLCAFDGTESGPGSLWMIQAAE
ncbi:MAG: Soluble aldose sugar dehydrogenase YliI precursor [Planctomycetota bacterium]